MDSVDLLLAKAQISLTRITLIGFLLMLFALLALLVFPSVKASAEVISLVSAATGSLGTILTQQNGYFFARHRQPAAPGDTSNPIQPPPAAHS